MRGKTKRKKKTKKYLLFNNNKNYIKLFNIIVMLI